MNNEDFRVRIDELAKRLHHLTQSKGAEYTHGKDNRFDNFERQAAALGLTREQVLFVFLTKHMDSITTYIADRARGTARDYSESMTGRVDDAILYLLLLRCMIEMNERPQTIELPFMAEPRLEQWPIECRANFGKGHWLHDAGSRKGGHGEGTGYSYTITFESELDRKMRESHHVLDTAESITVGGVTTRLREVESPQRVEGVAIDRKSRRVVISTHYANAKTACEELGLIPGVAALTAPDQLSGLTVGDHVTFVHGKDTPDLDRTMLGEVRDRAHRQGFSLDVIL